MAESFGEALRTAREAAGIDIRGLAETTRIQARYLEALEAEDWGVLPPGVIGRGFVRVVARELRLPSEEFLERYRAARGKEDVVPERHLPEADWRVELGGRRGMMPLALGTAAVVLLALVLLLWRPWQAGEAPPVPAPVAEIVPPASAPGAAGASKAEGVSPPAAETVQAPPKEDVPVGASRGREMEVEILAVDKVWVQLSSDGGQPKARELRPGERTSAKAAQGIEVKLGNAGAATLFWNGEELRPAGAVGQVVSLRFPGDAEKLRK